MVLLNECEYSFDPIKTNYRAQNLSNPDLSGKIPSRLTFEDYDPTHRSQSHLVCSKRQVASVKADRLTRRRLDLLQPRQLRSPTRLCQVTVLPGQPRQVPVRAPLT